MMVSIAERLDARVVGDDGEVYEVAEALLTAALPGPVLTEPRRASKAHWWCGVAAALAVVIHAILYACAVI